MYYLAPLGLALLSLLHTDFWRAGFFYGLLGGALFLIYKLKRYYHESITCLGGYLLLSYLYFCFYPVSPYQRFGIDAVYRFLWLQLTGLVLLIAAIALLETIRRRPWYLKRLEQFFCLLTITSSALMVAASLWARSTNGILNIESMDAVFIALTLPLLHKRGIVWLVLPITAILISHSATALVMVLVGAVAFHLPKLILYSVPAATIAFAAFWLGGFHLNAKFFSDSGRFHYIEQVLKYYFNKGNVLFGQGVSSFELWGPHIQSMTRHGITTWDGETKFPSFWIWLHSDWAQIFFESGFIGLLLSFWAYAYLLRRTWHNNMLRSALILYGLAMITQMPLRMFLPLTFGVYLIGACLIDSNHDLC